MGRSGLGEFEHQVLLTILRLGGEAYSVPIVAELDARTGREAATSAVYIALRRLEAKGMLTSRLESPEESGEPYPRRWFALTAGRARAAQGRQAGAPEPLGRPRAGARRLRLR